MPLFPVLIRIRGRVYTAESIPALQKLLAKKSRVRDGGYMLVDARWKAWAFDAERRIIAPSELKKKYAKHELFVFCGMTDEAAAALHLEGYSRNLIFSFLVQYVGGAR
jgi:hypothetical protein